MIGATSNSIISLIDDYIGNPVVRWSLEMSGSNIHIVSNLKALFGNGQDMIALASGGT